ncbi:hypothetical protein DM860_013267 [Cuscuta australis]|uniref:F-box domain-containing protein n=1 Tax=Cuscuta australis TaxID=267555 RepID=A0A328DNP9_9ASTE|nr:hypothetical protein DM860_013267 [Cuscuta australis]
MGSFIPEDLVLNILFRLPADVIYGIMQYVCREWYNIVRSPTFVSTHLQKSTGGAFLLQAAKSRPRYFLRMGKCGDDIELVEAEFPPSRDLASSCNGLVVMVHYNCRELCITNPVLKQQLTLPPHPKLVAKKFCKLAYDVSSGVYKVVVCNPWDPPTVLTVGDKTWRPLRSSCLFNRIVSDLHINRSLSLGSFLYWVSECALFVVSFNAETETFQEIPFPQGCTSGSPVALIEMGSFPCLMRWKEKWTWELWLSRDQENAGWEKMSDINLLGQSSLIRVLSDDDRCFLPLGWLKCGELMAFLVPLNKSRIIAYNVRLGKIHSALQLNPRMQHCNPFFIPHVNSLVSLTNFCSS